MSIIEIKDKSDTYYKEFETDDFKINGKTIEEHDAEVRAELARKLHKIYCNHRLSDEEVLDNIRKVIEEELYAND